MIQFGDLPKLLGMPFYETEEVQLYCEDSLKGMAKLPANSISLTVTSPPYNIGKEYETVVEHEHYLDWCETWIKQVYQCTASKGAFWLNIGYFDWPGRAKALPIAYCLWQRVPFYLIQEVVWHYGAGVSTKLMLCPRNEKVLFYVKNPHDYTFNLDAIRDPDVKYPTQKKNGKFKCNPLGKNPGDVWYIPKVTSGTDRASPERTPHPAQFPLALIERIVRLSSNEGDTVLDPFLGSGTTAVVCRKNGRKFLGFELKESYCQIAVDRLKALYVQPSLSFTAARGADQG
jgi:adenine-specific DNA-methyltransferase